MGVEWFIGGMIGFYILFLIVKEGGWLPKWT
jgi:hypothetical protein